MRTALLALVASTTLLSAPAWGRTLVNVDHRGLALEGYDPVSFVMDEKAEPGRIELSVEHAGAVYRFATAAHQQAFQKNPDRFLPQYGGFCAVSASMGKLEPVDLSTFSIVDGKLYLQRNAKAVAMWKKNPRRFIAGANKNWPKLEKAFATSLSHREVNERLELTLAGAKRMVDAAEAYAKKNRAPGGSIVIVDGGGHVIYAVRLDGTFPASARVATEKARTAAMFRMPSKNLEDAILNGRFSLNTVGHNMLRGGLPITYAGQVIGGVGVSGAASADQDVLLAEAALSADFLATE